MSYNPVYEASKALPVERIAEQLEDFAASGQNLSRRRFSRSPPTVPSVPSTTYEDSDPPSPGEQLRDRQNEELQNSKAGKQFAIQMDDELDRIRAARDRGLLRQPYISNLNDLEEAAEANVKYRWMRQGIWDDQWNYRPHGVWKHELQDFPQSARPSKSAKGRDLGARKNRTLADLEDEYQEIVRSADDFQKRQSSRPCYQFIHQFCEERQWIKMGFSRQDEDQPANLDMRAYENLKSRWIRDGIWDDDWTLIPGVSWKHERPRKIPDEFFRMMDAHKATRMEQAERPPDWYFMAPVVPLTMGRRHHVPRYSECASDPPGPSILEPSPEVISPQRDWSATTRASREMGSSRSTRQSTAKAKPNTAGQGQRPTRSPTKKSTVNTRKTKAKGKAPQKQKGHTPQSRTLNARPLKKRTFAKEETNHQSIQEAKTQTSNDATSSRTHRAAALVAMQKLTRAT